MLFRQREIFFSIIVTSFNYEKYIETCLTSLCDQTYKNFEVIVIDDCSSDNSSTIIQRFTQKYRNFLLYQNSSNIGLSRSIQKGILLAKGDFIAFCESDDFWTNNHLERLVKFLKKYPRAKIIVNNIQHFGDYLCILKKKEYFIKCSSINEGIHKFNLRDQKGCPIPGFSCCMLKKSILKGINFDTPNPSEIDLWIYRQILSRYPYFFINEKITFRRHHEDSYSVQTKKENDKNRTNLIELSNKIILRSEKAANFNFGFFHNSREILLVANSLTNSGAAIVLYEIAQELIKRNFQISVVALRSGEMLEKFKKLGEVSIHSEFKQDSYYLKHYCFALVITSIPYEYYKKLCAIIPTIWLILEGPIFIPKEIYSLKILHNDLIYTISEKNRQFLLNFIPKIKCFKLGIKDDYRNSKINLSNGIIFALIGRVDKNKGADIFINAVNILPKNIRSQAKFIIIGKSTAFRKELELKFNCQNVTFIEEISPENMPLVYEKISCLVISSREDTLPTVALEAMMMGRPVIMSDSVGATYLLNQNNGFSFAKENSSDLSQKIEMLIRKPSLLPKMGMEARKTYLSMASYSTFRSSIDEILNAMRAKKKSF